MGGSKRTAFEALVHEAVEVTQRLDVLNHAGGKMLTADAFLREMLVCARSDASRIVKLRSALDSGSVGRHTDATLRRMITFLRGSNCPRPPKDPQRLNFLTTDAATGELSRLGMSTAELFAVAVQIAGEDYPELFGSEESTSHIDNELATLRARQAELFKRIPAELTAADMHIGPLDPQGLARVTFKLSDGNVSIAPAENSGERLVRYLVANQRKF